METLKGKRS